MKKAILFDFDGTLADTMETAVKAIQTAAKRFGYNLSKKDIEALRNMGALQVIMHLKFPIWKIPAIIKEIRSEVGHEINKIKPFPEIKKVLIKLKAMNFQLTILTSNNTETVEKFLNRNNLLFFDHILTEPDIFKKSRLLKKFLYEQGLTTKDVIYVGDEIRDIEFCRESKIPIISVTWGFNHEKALKEMEPDYIAKKPSEIPKIMEKLV